MKHRFSAGESAYLIRQFGHECAPPYRVASIESVFHKSPFVHYRIRVDGQSSPAMDQWLAPIHLVIEEDEDFLCVVDDNHTVP